MNDSDLTVIWQCGAERAYRETRSVRWARVWRGEQTGAGRGSVVVPRAAVGRWACVRAAGVRRASPAGRGGARGRCHVEHDVRRDAHHLRGRRQPALQPAVGRQRRPRAADGVHAGRARQARREPPGHAGSPRRRRRPPQAGREAARLPAATDPRQPLAGQSISFPGISKIDRHAYEPRAGQSPLSSP